MNKSLIEKRRLNFCTQYATKLIQNILKFMLENLCTCFQQYELQSIPSHQNISVRRRRQEM